MLYYNKSVSKMGRSKRFILIFFIICIHYCQAFNIDGSSFSVSAKKQTKAAWDLIKRVIPEKAYLFKTQVNLNHTNDGKEIFTLLKTGEIVEISGSSGLSVAWGFHYYIKNFCKAHIGWQVRQVNLPEVLPFVNVSITAKDRFRYYQNVCTTSYSFAWWDENKWREHIDWMALNGINIALASHGQEAIWERVYGRLNLTSEEIQEHFAGPAFLSWQRMGNIRGWGGPLSSDWHRWTLQLQHFIVNAYRELGIIPVLPAFAGFVPKAFKRLYPDARMTEVEPWNNFESEFCCPLYLDPSDPLFGIVGQMFLTEMTQEFGKYNYYNSDPFNEVKPTSEDSSFLKKVGAAIHESMTAVDSDAIWLLQNWMFVHESLYWTRERVEALLTSVPLGKILVLDLQSEQWPQYGRFDMYFGQPFIWCMLHNFGGTLGMFGDSHSVNTDVYRARYANDSTMVGVGLTPEGINQNNVMYELMLESSLREEPVEMETWIGNYTERRYGISNDNVYRAWSTLMKSLYNYTGLNKIRGKYSITRRPSLDIKPWAWYSCANLFDSWKYMILALDSPLNTSRGYRHDLVDLTRQSLQYKGDQIYIQIKNSFKSKNIIDLQNYSALFMEVFEDLQKILSSCKDFLLGNWLEDAKSLAKNEQDKILFEFNARNQITLWGPKGEICDYANKQWAGIIEDFLKPRWEYFLSAMQHSVKNNYAFNKTAVLRNIFVAVEQPFTFSQKVYPTEADGDLVETALKIFTKWSQRIYTPDIPIKFISKPSLETKSIGKDLLLRLSRDTEEEYDFDEEVHYQAILTH